MTSSDPGGWQRTSPFAIVFFVGKTIKTYARNFAQLIVTFGALAVLIRRNPYLFLLIPLGVLAIVASGVLQYWFFRFKIQDDRILIRQGVLKKTSLDLPFDRVQGINVERSLVDRILGLVTVSLDTAGSAGAEGQLPSVNTELADLLRVRVGARQRARSADAVGGGDEQPTGVAAERGTRGRPGLVGAREVLLKLTGGDMVRIGLSNRNMLFVVAFLGAFNEFLGFAEDTLDSAFESAETALSGMDDLVRTSLVAGFVLVVLCLVLVLAIGGAFLRYHNFTLWREGTAFRSRAGLLTQKEVVVEAAKIQQLTLTQSLMMRIFRRHRLRALPASLLPGQGSEAAVAAGLAELLEVPALQDHQAEDLRSRVFGHEGTGLTLRPHDKAFTHISPHYIRALTLRISAVFAVIGATILIPLAGFAFARGAAIAVLIGWLLSIPLAALIAWQLWRRQAYLHDDDGLASRGGFIGRRVDAFLFRKAQSVTVTQSPLQRRKGLATLQVQLASGQVSVPYLDHGVACRLRDYVLYRVEASRVRWH